MGIDRIGKEDPASPPKPVSGPERATGAGGGRLRGRSRWVPLTPQRRTRLRPWLGRDQCPLARLRAGEIDLDRYLDLKVDEATAHLKGLRAHEMSGLRSLLRAQLVSDPSMVNLVQQATGHTPVQKE